MDNSCRNMMVVMPRHVALCQSAWKQTRWPCGGIGETCCGMAGIFLRVPLLAFFKLSFLFYISFFFLSVPTAWETTHRPSNTQWKQQKQQQAQKEGLPLPFFLSFFPSFSFLFLLSSLFLPLSFFFSPSYSLLFQTFFNSKCQHFFSFLEGLYKGRLSVAFQGF